MIALALYAADPHRRRDLEQQARMLAGVRVVGAADSPASLARLIEEEPAAVILAGGAAPPLPATKAALLVLIEDEEAALDALASGAQAVLPRNAAAAEIGIAVAAAAHGLAVLPRDLLDRLAGAAALAPSSGGETASVELTAREIEVLSALAGGASNKAIARRLGVSFHTVKFHVAAILAKLDADSRTEAVAKAARLGLIML